MKFRNKPRQIYLISIFICVLTPLAHAGSSDDSQNKTANATKQVMNETVEGAVGNKPASTPQEKPKENNQSEPQKPELQTLANSAETPEPVAETPSVNLDIVGFRVGMSPDEVREKLLDYRDDFKIEIYNSIPASQNKKSEVINKDAVDVVQNVDENNLPEHVYEIRAYVQGGNESFELNFLKPPASNTLYSISRILTFTKDTAPEDKKIVAKLKGKYGQVSSKETADSIQWVYDDNGDLRLELSSYLEQYCDGRMDESFPLLDATGGCGTWVYTNFWRIYGTNFIRYLTVTVSEVKTHLSNEKESKVFVDQLRNSELNNKNVSYLSFKYVVLKII
ncbi:MAG: hypothetical protein V7707_19870 [Motiliproteus sp.]